MQISVSFVPLLPTPLLLVLAFISLALLGFAIFRNMRGWLLRSLAVTTLGIALAGPMINEEQRAGQNSIVFLVADKTQSQRVGNREEQIETALSSLREEIGEHVQFEIREITVENNITERDSGSNVLTALSKASLEVAESRIAGAIVLTDGRIHDSELIKEFPAPLHVLKTGRKADWDKRLELINAPTFAIVDEEIILKLRIEEDGAVPTELVGNANLKISIDGDEFGTFRLPTEEDIDLPLRLKHGGANIVQLEVEPNDGELTDRNNNAVLSINGVRDRLRVLLVSGEPHSGERTWRNLLKSDSAVELVHFTILRSSDKIDNVPVKELSLISFPTRQLFSEKIDEFDLIVFDRYKRRGMLAGRYLDNVVEYVEKGGAVLIAAGDSFAGADSLYRTELRDILPATPTARVIEKGYRPKINEVGKRHPVTEGLEAYSPNGLDENQDPNWGRWFRLIDAVPESGNVVMQGAEDKPLLVLDRVGEGRVALLLSDHAWLWSRGYEGGGPQLELLRRLAHWMMKEPDLEEERLSVEADGPSVLVRRRSLKDDDRVLEVIEPDGTARDMQMIQVSPGVWEAEINGEENGLYRFKEGEETAVMALGPALPKEFERVISDTSLLKPLVNKTKAGILDLESVPTPEVRLVRQGRRAAGERWIGITDRQAYVTTSVRQTPILPNWIYLLLAAALCVAAWWYEGRREVK